MVEYLHSSKELQGLPGFLFAIIGQEPGWRFGHEIHGTEK